MDSSLRGYLATGDRFFADEATKASPALAAADSQMVNVLDEPALRQSVLQLLLAQERWRTEWADEARQVPPPGGTEAFLLQGKALFDSYSARKDGHAHRDPRRDRRQRAERPRRCSGASGCCS